MTEVAVIVVEPTPLPVTRPLSEIVAMLLSPDDQVTFLVASSGETLATLSCSVS